MNSNWKDGIDKLLMSKRYDELDKADAAWVDEHLGGRFEYDSLAEVVRNASLDQQLPTDAATKKALIGKMKSKNRPIWVRFMAHKTPTYMASAMFVIGVAVAWALMPKPKIVTVPVTTLQVDTVRVFVQSLPDTVIIEQKVNVPVYVVQTPEPIKQKSQPSKKKDNNNMGKPLAEQYEMRSLLVQTE